MKPSQWLSRLAVAAALFVASATAESRAALTTFTSSTTGSGSLGGVGFTNAVVQLTATVDTSQVTGTAPLLFFLPPITATVSVAGLGSATFTSSTFGVFVNQTYNNGGVTGIAGFSDTSLGTLLGTSNSGFQTYTLTTSIGPLSGPTFIRPDLSFATTSGALILSSAPTATFQATTTSAVPEPSSLALCGLGLAGIGTFSGRRRMRRA